MKKHQLVCLFLCNCIPMFVGMGLFPILPLYAAQFGATHTTVGIYYAATYAASMAGITLAGWLSERMSRRALFVIGGLLGIPALALLGVATEFWQTVILTAAVWFSGAITITLVNVFIGLLSDNSRRGTSFGVLFAAYPLGSLCGGAAVGQLIAWRGYPTMFAVLTVFWVLLPLLGMLGLRGLYIQQPVRTAQSVGDTPPLGRPFLRLLLIALLGALAINIGRLGVSLSMQALGFQASAVASTAAVSGLIVIPVSVLIGTLADRLGQRRMLAIGYGLALVGVLLLLVAAQLWQFWLAATLLFVAWCVNGAMTSALASDTLAPAMLGRGLPRLNATDSLASMLGFLAAGYGMDQIGSTGLYFAAATVLVLAAPLLGTLRQPKHTSSLAHPINKTSVAPRAPLAEPEGA